MIQIIILTATILVFLMAGIPVMHRAILDNRIDHIKKLEELNPYD